MINKTVLLLAVDARLAATRPGSAQSVLSDVPAQHWASGAVKELQLRGMLTGYPDGSFGADTCPYAGGLDQNIYGDLTP